MMCTNICCIKTLRETLRVIAMRYVFTGRGCRIVEHGQEEDRGGGRGGEGGKRGKIESSPLLFFIGFD